MTSRQLMSVGADRFRVGPWHADRSIAHLSIQPSWGRPSAQGLAGCLVQIADAGYSSVITAALHPEEAASFFATGFEEYDRVHVLTHDLQDLDPPRPVPDPGTRLRRARRRDRDEALKVDARAFPVLWRLDHAGMADAERATPTTRFRVADLDGRVLGYAITGRGGSQAFLQRLATDPDLTGHGIGSALVVDALKWAARRRCARILVNTQRQNTRAMDVYRRLGFRSTATDLVVLRRSVP